MAIQIGDKAPEILGLDQNGKEIKLSDFKGKKLALYLYCHIFILLDIIVHLACYIRFPAGFSSEDLPKQFSSL